MARTIPGASGRGGPPAGDCMASPTSTRSPAMSRITVTRPSLARLAVAAVSAAAALASLPAPNAAAQETVCKGRAVTIMGTATHDRINGTAGTDVISTGPGNDLVNAGG